ncbi:DUF1045 domain-containing protein [Zavarzinia aquatilis]|uniref:DUF1045 domain-containing protein n=1 Tax=Zavarzinia aquatilis TaxID=2211142 RepID=UPI00105824AE|nr:DUF1045 domain-containing protein [Zavarzinia aquatilis]
MAYRYALYWAPPVASPLHRLGSQWLGRDAETGAPAAQPLLPPITPERFAEITAEPRGYGFHATLKPPMRLRDGISPDDFIEAARGIVAGIKTFAAPPLKVGRIGGFLALVPAGDMAPWRALADPLVAGLDEFRAPPTAAEIEKRKKHPLSPAQDALLARWGYPYVFDEWRFHMTLSANLTSPERERVEVAALGHFAPIEGRPVTVGQACVFVQDSPGAPFTVRARLPLAA